MKETNKGITLVALIITIIVMLILVGVTIQLVINSGLFETAKNVTIKTEEEYRNESAIGNEIAIDGTTYSSIEEYIKQLNCTHEWGEWNENPENCVGTRTCTKCGKVETAQLPHTFQEGICTVCEHELVIGAYIEGYNPSIAEDGSTINTTYISLGSRTGGTYENDGTRDGTSGNGYSDQEFQVNSITKWRVVGEENGQILITTADTVSRKDEGDFYLSCEAGYANIIDELNKISSIYGQGKYADTTKYSVDLNGTTIATAGRSITHTDAGYTRNPECDSAIYSRNEDGIIVINNVATESTAPFYYFDETNNKWESLDTNESVVLSYYKYTGNMTEKQKEMVFTDSHGEKAEYFFAYRHIWGIGETGVTYQADRVSGGNWYGGYLTANWHWKVSTNAKIRPVVYLKSDVAISYDETTGIYTIE